MKYNLHFYKNNTLKEIKTDNVFMHGEDGKLISIKSSNIWDKIMLFDDGNRYIATYCFDFKDKEKLIFKR